MARSQCPGSILRGARKRRRLTQVEVQEKLGWPQALISAYERCSAKPPPAKLGRLLDVYAPHLDAKRLLLAYARLANGEVYCPDGN